MPTIKLIIKGKVQGVFYRATAKEVADGLHVKGWIKNSPDGNVEAIVTGANQALQDFVNWCKQGSKGADVSNVEVINYEEQVFNEFEIMH